MPAVTEHDCRRRRHSSVFGQREQLWPRQCQRQQQSSKPFDAGRYYASEDLGARYGSAPSGIHRHITAVWVRLRQRGSKLRLDLIAARKYSHPPHRHSRPAIGRDLRRGPLPPS
jgi:hypothetical protein